MNKCLMSSPKVNWTNFHANILSVLYAQKVWLLVPSVV